MAKRLDLTGRTFGRLSVEGRVQGGTIWDCLCECGARLQVKSTVLSRGRKKSCGCLQRESRDRNFAKRGQLKYPATPDPYPTEAALLFKQYQYLIEILLKQRGDIIGLQETATDLLMRACWVVVFKSHTEKPIDEAKIKAYLCGWLFKERAVLRNIRNGAIVRGSNKTEQGGTMTDLTLNDSTTPDSADILLPVHKSNRRLKFDRR